MLYEFHRNQNAMKPGTIHATYLISGTRLENLESAVLNKEYVSNNEDNDSLNSPFTCSMSSIPEQNTTRPSIKTITLVREEELNDMLSKYEIVDSIHVYSIGPHPLKDLQVLSDATRELKELCSEEDLLKSHMTYGSIENKNVKLCSGRKPLSGLQNSLKIPKPSSSVLSDSRKAPTLESDKKIKSAPSAQSSLDRAKSQKTADTGTNLSSKLSRTDSIPKPSLPPKHDPASILSAFARTESKPKQVKTNHPKSVDEDYIMEDVLFDDDDDEETWAPIPSLVKDTTSNQKSRKEREEELKKMMDENEDEADEDNDSTLKTGKNKLNETTLEELTVKAPEQKPVTVVKKRSRRRIMKKKTFQDEEGYLVTKEEPAWESFSEDERVPNPIAKTLVTTNSKVKKLASGKSAQGSITSFFGKR